MDDIIFSVYVIVLLVVMAVFYRSVIVRKLSEWNERRMIKQKTKLGIELESRKGKVVA